MPEYMCEHSNCWEMDTPIILTVNNTDPKERVRFCSLAHLVLWTNDKIKLNFFASLQPFTAERARS